MEIGATDFNNSAHLIPVNCTFLLIFGIAVEFVERRFVRYQRVQRRFVEACSFLGLQCTATTANEDASWLLLLILFCFALCRMARYILKVPSKVLILQFLLQWVAFAFALSYQCRMHIYQIVTLSLDLFVDQTCAFLVLNQLFEE